MIKLAVWSPLPPSASGIADYAAEQIEALARRAEVTVVVEDPRAVDAALGRRLRLAAAADDVAADLDLYQLGNSPAHGYVYRQALRRPGVVVLHDFSLHHLVLRETVGSGDRAAYLREMRRAYGEVGSFVGRQVARGLGGEMFPALLPLNEGVLRQALGVVGLTRFVVEGARQRLPADRPLLRLPHHVALPGAALPSREEARRALGLPAQALLLTAPGLVTASKRLDVVLRALHTIGDEVPEARLVIAGGVEPGLALDAWIAELGLERRVIRTGRLPLHDFVLHLVAADVLLALRFPHHGEISGALVRGLGVGRPALVTAGTPAAEEFPDGLVVPVDPGPAEAFELAALLRRLLADAALRETIGRLARDHVRRHHDLETGVATLASFLDEVLARKPETLRALAAGRLRPGSLLEFLHQEVAYGAYDLGLAGLDLGVEPLLAGLGEPEP